MKREEFIEKCDLLRYETKWSAKPWHYWLDEMDDHDAEQRAEIARLRAALEGMLFIFGHNDGYAQVKTAKQAFKKE